MTDDPEFLQNLYRRQEVLRRVEEMTKNGEEIRLGPDLLRFRHGISPVAKNIRNIRYRKE